MPLSIDHFKNAATQFPDAEALVVLPEKEEITSSKAPRMGLLSIFGIGSYFDELEKSRSIVKDFKAALVEKYGEEISDFVFPAQMEGAAATSSLKSHTVSRVLQQAEILDLLKQAIIETITDEHAEPEPEDSPFINVPGEAQRIFSQETIANIKKAYYDVSNESLKFMFGERQEFSLSSLPSVQTAQRLVKENLQTAGLADYSSFVSEYFPVKAMRAAMEADPNLRDIILAPLMPPVPTQATSVTPSEQDSTPMAVASRTTDSNSSPATTVAVPLTPPQNAIRINDPEWNI